jgi:hypothetical protein
MNPHYSISHSDIIITVASWEERFLLGLEKLKKDVRPVRVIMFHYDEYADWSKENRETAQRFFSPGVPVVERKLFSRAPLETWKHIADTVFEHVQAHQSVTLHISTMPREAIWIICACVRAKGCEIQYVYNKPIAYAEDWLSRDPGRPRIVYKLAGIFGLNLPTTLLVITGFDSERTKQLVRFYEPRNVVIGLQQGDQYENIIKNRKEHQKAFDRNKGIRWFDVDGYDIESTLASVESNLKEFIEDTNVILTSLGPKISALALYKYHLNHEKAALVYAPANEVNRDYSNGLKETLSGRL